MAVLAHWTHVYSIVCSGMASRRSAPGLIIDLCEPVGGLGAVICMSIGSDDKMRLDWMVLYQTKVQSYFRTWDLVQN